MAAVKKRRKVTKAKTKVKKAKKKKKVIYRSGSLEFMSLLLLCLAVFLLISVISLYYYMYSSDGVVTPNSLKVNNIMGPVGYLFSTLLDGLLGFGGLVFIAVLIGFAFFMYNDSKEYGELNFNSPILRVVGGVFLVVSFSSILHFFLNGIYGGLIGAKFFNLFGMFFGPVGSLIISLGVFAVSLAWFLEDRFLAFSNSIFTIGASAVILCLWEYPKAIALKTFELLTNLYYKLISGFSSESYEYEDEYEEEDDDDDEYEDSELEKEVVVKKNRKLRKNEIKEPEPTHIVVNRRKDIVKKKSVINHNSLLNEKYKDYALPDVKFLTKGENNFTLEDDDILLKKSKKIESKLADFKINGRITQVHPGPVITLFEFEPAPGVKVGKIASLQDDLAMSLKASSIRILAPIPNKGTVGIEIPNSHTDIVRLRDVIESAEFQNEPSSLAIALGKDTYGEPVVEDLARMPHLLMAGATGTGKSVSINALLISLLYRASPKDLGLILIDPKILELSVYEDIPHLRVPVVTVPKQAKAVLSWAVKEMDKRYRLMQKYGVRNIDGFNAIANGVDENHNLKTEDFEDVVKLDEDLIVEEGTVGNAKVGDLKFTEEVKPLSKLVIVIDELADLMLTVGRDIEELITRLAQKARAAGIHLVVATQRPSVDVITGLIKANFPARLSFRVSSRIDSRTILDSMGAEKLLGKGDMLVKLPGASHAVRAHGAYVSDNEVRNVIADIKKKYEPSYDQEIMKVCQKALEDEESENDKLDDLGFEKDDFYDRAVELVLQKGQASTSMLQRAFRIGYNRAARIVDSMEANGIIGPMDGSRPREVLISDYDTEEVAEEADLF